MQSRKREDGTGSLKERSRKALEVTEEGKGKEESAVELFLSVQRLQSMFTGAIGAHVKI